MSKENNNDNNDKDQTELPHAIIDMAERSQRVIAEFIEQKVIEQQRSGPDPYNVSGAFAEMAANLLNDPKKVVNASFNLWQDYLTLGHALAHQMLGETIPPVVEPAPTDKRFKDDMWQQNMVFDFIKQTYLVSARWAQNLVNSVDDLDQSTAQKVDFHTRQMIDALAPSNFVITNPEVLRATVETRGENLVKGLNNLLADIERGKGKLSISMTDYDAFKVGENIAATPGKVIYRNDMIELIQYAPTTEQVNETPLLIVPPWINKYYVLDLKPRNSFVAWARDQGHTVFIISWVNPDTSLAEKNFDHYMAEGPLAAMDAIEQATGAKQVNALGFCLGGTLLTSTLAWLTAKGQASRVKCATLLATMTDFSQPGELGVFIDEMQVRMLENKMSAHGYLEAHELFDTFNKLRANDLIWSFVIRNYLLGKDPYPFDLLYWNSDTTRMPAAMFSTYLRKMYKENQLVVPGGITMNGVALDLSKIKTPLYMMSAHDDHIAPWASTFSLTGLAAGPVRFVLGGSGHIAGVINPPIAQKYCYWTNSRKYKNPQTWLAAAKENPGSWWTDWAEWIAKSTGPKVPARHPGDGALSPLCDAPGTYVRVMAD